jgi:hypothetical protein
VPAATTHATPAPPQSARATLQKLERATGALRELRAIVASEGYAMTALTLGGYRTDLLATIDNYLQECTP